MGQPTLCLTLVNGDMVFVGYFGTFCNSSHLVIITRVGLIDSVSYSSTAHQPVFFVNSHMVLMSLERVPCALARTKPECS